MTKHLTALTLTCLVAGSLASPARATPNLLQESHAEQQVRQLEELERDLSPVREQRRASDLEIIVRRIVGFCDSFYGCGAGVRVLDW